MTIIENISSRDPWNLSCKLCKRKQEDVCSPVKYVYLILIQYLLNFRKQLNACFAKPKLWTGASPFKPSFKIALDRRSEFLSSRYGSKHAS